MAKFRIRLKVQALELEIDGEREDIPLITKAVNRQFSGLVESADAAADGHKQLPAPSPDIETISKGKGSRRTRATKLSTESATPIEFRHDSSKYGNPVQTWSIIERCIWLLYVLKNVASVKEVSAAQLTATFNEQFKFAGKVHPPLVSRELTKAKGANPAPIGENKGLFFLMGEGDRQAKELMQAVQNP